MYSFINLPIDRSPRNHRSLNHFRNWLIVVKRFFFVILNVSPRFCFHIVLSSIETLEELTILFDDNSSSLFSFLLQNIFNYPANHYNNELLLQCIIQNPAVDYSIINSENATGKYLIQVFVKSLSMANPHGMINHSFITTTNIYLHCCRVSFCSFVNTRMIQLVLKHSPFRIKNQHYSFLDIF